jgi:small subunit ribosomal protein S10
MSAALKKTEKEIIPKLRIKLRAYDHKVIDKSSQQIIDMAERCGVKIAGPVPLPVEVSKFTVNRSTFVHKSAREQFEMRIHKRIIDILNPNQKVVESLKSLTLPAGVDTEIKSIL